MKPNNLLIAADGQLKLGDFGLARIFGSPDRRFTHQVSIVEFFSPEIYAGTWTLKSMTLGFKISLSLALKCAYVVYL